MHISQVFYFKSIVFDVIFFKGKDSVRMGSSAYFYCTILCRHKLRDHATFSGKNQKSFSGPCRTCTCGIRFCGVKSPEQKRVSFPRFVLAMSNCLYAPFTCLICISETIDKHSKKIIVSGLEVEREKEKKCF